MAFNVATAYQNNKINTASPEESTLIVYEAIIKFCNIAILGIENKDVNKTHGNIVKAQKAISYLQSTLDLTYEVSKNFNNIYVYAYDRLVEANIKKDKEIVEEVLEHMRGLRDTWKEVMKVK